MSTFSNNTRETLHDFSFFSVVKGSFHESNTDKRYEYYGVGHIGAVVAVPIMDNGDVVLIEQYRPLVDEMSLEAVAGRRDVDNEAPADAALRELEEEVAISAEKITPLGFTYSSPGFTDEKLMIYLAQQCKEINRGTPDGIEEELSVTHRMPLKDALKMSMEGEIVDAKTVVALLKVAHYLGEI